MTQLSNRQFAIYLALLFATGVAFGATVTWTFSMRSRTQHTPRPPGPPSPAEMAKFMERRLTSSLALTPDQVLQIRPILERTAERCQMAHAQTAKEIAKSFDQQRQEILAVLRPEQREKFEAQERERRAKFDRIRASCTKPSGTSSTRLDHSHSTPAASTGKAVLSSRPEASSLPQAAPQSGRPQIPLDLDK